MKRLSLALAILVVPGGIPAAAFYFAHAYLRRRYAIHRTRQELARHGVSDTREWGRA